MQALIDFLLNTWSQLLPWVFLDPWECGIRVRAGKWVKDLGPGPHFTIPFIDKVETINVKRQWVAVQEQTVETHDNVPMLLGATINYRISTPRKIWIEVQDHDDSLVEECAVRLARWINTHEYEEVTIDSLVSECYDDVRKMGFKWGCEVLELGIKTLAKHRAYRIMMG